MNMTFAAQLRKMITAGLGGDVEAPETGVAVGRTTVYTDLEAAPVQTFETNAELPITNLKVWMEPIQDLHGQDAPYPAGGGVNIMPVYPVTKTADPSVTTDGDIYTINGTADRYNQVTASEMFTLPAGDYYFQAFTVSGTGSANVQLRSVDGLTTYANIANSGGTAFNLTERTEVKFRITWNAGTFTNLKIQCMVSKGTTAPTAYAPYSNICPISGRDEVNVYVSPTTDKEDGTTYEIPLGSTVYGGSLDVTTGALTVTHANIASYDGETINEPWISSMDAYTEGGTPTTGAQVVYPLSEPEIVQLDPIEVKALIGTNNVFSDSGDVSLTYGTVRYTEGY